MEPNAASRPAGGGHHSIRRWRQVVLAAGAFAITACDRDVPTGSPVRIPAALQQVSGNGQSAPPGAELDRPLVARVLDADGHPVPGTKVRWRAVAGVVTPPVSATDANGEAHASWRVGSEPGMQRVVAEADGVQPIEFVAYVDPDIGPGPLPISPIVLETYDGSGQVVHPDILAAPFSGLDGRSRLAITPYPWGNANMENPSLFAGHDGHGWVVPPGVINPVVKPVGGYLSDPDILWDPDEQQMRLYYRHVTSANHILLVTSHDGVTFSSPVTVVSGPNHTIVSPTVVRRSVNEWLMWSINSGPIGCAASSTTVEVRRSRDGVHWSAPSPVSLSQPGVFAWHIEVQWVAPLGEYWALYNGKVRGSCTTDALYLATSTDGVTWRTYPSPVLRSGAIPELDDVVYRATFAYDAERDLVAFWHSGARYRSGTYEWRAAYERRTRSELFAAVNRPASAHAFRRPPPLELDNRTAP